MISRRQFLNTLGISGAAASLGLFRNPIFAADAAKKGSPKRLIIISHAHGWVYDGWKMRPKGFVEDKEWELDLTKLSKDQFSSNLAALYEHRKRLLVPDGLSMGTAELDVEGYRHFKGWLQAWTGNFSYFNGSQLGASSASLDQIVAKQIARPDHFPSIEIDMYGAEPGRPINHAGRGLFLPLERSPRRLWNRLLGPSKSGDPQVKLQGTALDFVRQQYQALAPKLASDDKKKLDLHFDLVRSLEQRIENISTVSCGEHPAPSESLASYKDRLEAFFKLVSVAFSCDLTRVASISLGDMSPQMFGYDQFKEDATHKGIAHNVYDDANAAKGMTKYMDVHAKQIADFITLLSSIPDGEGKSLMDNTLIVWGSELADGWHGYRHYCPLLIGGSWHFKTGRYLYWPHKTPIEILSPNEEKILYSGKPHQHLLVSAAQAMGLKQNHVGIEKVQGQRGDKINCSGPLPGLV